MEEETSSCDPRCVQPPGEPPTATWTCDLLKKFLRSRGGHLTGKKRDLLERYVDDDEDDDCPLPSLQAALSPLGIV